MTTTDEEPVEVFQAKASKPDNRIFKILKYAGDDGKEWIDGKWGATEEIYKTSDGHKVILKVAPELFFIPDLDLWVHRVVE